MRIELACEFCGMNSFAFPPGGDDESKVACTECGHFVGTMGELKDAVATAVIEKEPVPRLRKRLGNGHAR